MVSHPAWYRCVSYRQETFRPEISRLRFAPLEMTERHGAAVFQHGAIAFHTGRKLFANGFPSGIAPLRFITAGNFLQMVSHPAWLHCVSSRQETIRKWFPIRHDSTVFHRGRKLFANGFLSGMAPLRFIAVGNFSQIVSYPAWLHCVSYRQETFREWFPIRHGSIAFHNGRKLFANGFPSGMAPLRFITTGNYSQMVSHPA